MINNLLKFSIARRFIIFAAIIVIVVLGLWNYQRLAIDAVPDITNVQVQINSEAPGYSPLETEQRITFVVETALSGLPHLAYTRSLSRYGLSQVTVVFDDGTDIYFARNLIDQRLNAIKNQLPAGVETNMGPIATGLGEIFMYTVEAQPGAKQANGQEYDAMALREIQDWILRPQLVQVKGVTEVNSIGGYNKQYQISPKLTQLLALNLTMDDIHQALVRNNQNQGAGYIENDGQQWLVRAQGQLEFIADIEAIVIAEQQGVPIRIKDVASVAIGKELRTGAATQNGKETVLGTAIMLVGENSRDVSRRFEQALSKANLSMPAGVVAIPVYNRTTLVDKAIATVQKNLLEGALLVIVVLFVLLGNLRAALITAAVIPITMLMTITGMVHAGVSANLMSLGALDFGLIVDAAVIIVENCMRRLAEAQRINGGPLNRAERFDLTFSATNEVIRPSLFGVAIITFVYLPIFSLTGVEGKMFHPMAITVVIALLSAIALSLTFVPAALAVFLKDAGHEQENKLLQHIQGRYQPLLKTALGHRKLFMASAAALTLFCTWLLTTLGTEFLPALDEGDIAMHALRIPGTGLEQAVKMQTQLEARIKQFPEVDKVFAKIGTAEVATDPMPPNVADNLIMLKPRQQWPDPQRPKADLIAAMEQAVQEVPGNNYEFTQPIAMRFNELISGVRSDLGIKIMGDDLDKLLVSANQVLAAINNIEGIADARVEQVTGLPMLSIKPKREAMANYGVSLADMQNLIHTAIAGKQAGVMFAGDRRFDIVIRLPETLIEAPGELENLPVPIQRMPGSSSLNFVPLSEIAEITLAPAPNQISRENGKRLIIVTANVRGRDLGSLVTEVQNNIRTQVTLPAGYWIDYGGTFEQMQSASKRLSVIVPLTLIIVIGLLIIAFNSLKDALIIFSGVPLALTGGVIALWLRGMPLSLSAAVGFIALSGIAVLNGMVMVSFIRNRCLELGRLESGRLELGHVSIATLEQAIIEGALTRLRPVLMTALVASLGFVPMAFNVGIGAEVQKPLATVVIGGIISSTLLTLLVLPGLYRAAYGRRD